MHILLNINMRARVRVRASSSRSMPFPGLLSVKERKVSRIIQRSRAYPSGCRLVLAP
jgi:Holliday junction resolvase-like predicted endonuclease